MNLTPVANKGGKGDRRENWGKEVVEWGAKHTLTETRTLEVGSDNDGTET